MATGQPQVVLAGHGSFNSVTDAKFPKVKVPAGVTLVFWCHHGEPLLNTIGKHIESGANLHKLPDRLLELAAKAGLDTKDLPEIYTGGQEIWNYRLTYPSGLSLARSPKVIMASVYNPAIPSGAPHTVDGGSLVDDRYCIVPPLAGSVADRGVPIIAMLAGYWGICKGSVVHWCACRSIAAR